MLGKSQFALKRTSSLLMLAMVLMTWSCAQRKPQPSRITSAEVFFSDEMMRFKNALEQHRSFPHATIAVVDIDDTLITANGLLGTPSWFYTMVKVLRERGVSRLEAYKIIGDIDHALQPHITTRPVESFLPKTIEAWQKKGVIVVALTSRPHTLKNITSQQLKKANIAFSHPVFPCVSDAWTQELSAFVDGVLYVGDQPKKSEVFNHFLTHAQRCGYQVELIAHTDDQPKYVYELQDLAREKNMWFIGQIYERALKERQFNLKKANQELHQLIESTGVAFVPAQHLHFFN